MVKKYLLILIMVGFLKALPYQFYKNKGLSGGTKDDAYLTVNQTLGGVWNYVSNFGSFGGEFGSGLWGLSWPGGAAVNNYYLWGSYFTVGYKVNGIPYVTNHNYPMGEWYPCEDFQTTTGPGKSPFDVVTCFQDYKDFNPNNSGGRHTGIKVIVRAMQWPNYPFNDFIAYEIYITYNSSQCDIPGHGTSIDSLYVGQWYDCDVSGVDQSNPHIDDMVAFDGWTNGEWENLPINPPIGDFGTVLSDTFIPVPDGVPDNYIIWGDEPGELVRDSSIAVDYTSPVTGNPYKVYIFPRGASYIYDGDDPANPGDDTGENGAAAGYVGGAWIYAPLDKLMVQDADSVIDAASGAYFVRPWSHQWWNWEHDPATDEDIYNYLAGHSTATQYFRFAPLPYDLGQSVFDYRFLNTVGPFHLEEGDTLKLVWVAGVGQGLNGGVDEYWGRGYLHGLRQVINRAFYAYYAGAQHSDPAHPSSPDEDVHWKIPVPPVAPSLIYSASVNGVRLLWDNKAEVTPDPIKGVVDVQGYRVYRAKYQPLSWELLADLPKNPDGSFAHSFLDTTLVPGFPYFYVVTAYDNDTSPTGVVGLESGKTNYLKDENGNPLPVTRPTKFGESLDDVVVVPNPYYGNAVWTAHNEIADKIEFQNLPRSCAITIYTLNGHKIITLYNTEGKGSLSWNLLTEEGMKVSTGTYIYKVTTPDGKVKLGKFMILR